VGSMSVNNLLRLLPRLFFHEVFDTQPMLKPARLQHRKQHDTPLGVLGPSACKLDRYFAFLRAVHHDEKFPPPDGFCTGVVLWLVLFSRHRFMLPSFHAARLRGKGDFPKKPLFQQNIGDFAQLGPGAQQVETLSS